MGGVATAWFGPDLPDEDNPGRNRSRWERLMIRVLGVAFITVGTVIILDGIWGARPGPGGDGPLV